MKNSLKHIVMILPFRFVHLKFIYSGKATKFCEIYTNYLFYVPPVKWMVEISQNFVAFSEYTNFTRFKTNNYFRFSLKIC